MSLFQARDWWGLQCADEYFDNNSLCVANIDNSPEGIDKLMVGSHSGILRVFAINREFNEAAVESFRANDLLLESDLQSPILQVCSGMFLSATDKINLAVLHPRKLCVYSISAIAGVAVHGSAYNMLLIYEHNLQRSAHSLIVGSFGHVKGRDFLCIQCLDGTLSFYEQESFAFSRYLPNFLLPGPLAYVSQNDSFIVSTSNWSIECYRYQVLAISKEDDESNNLKNSGRKATPDWIIMLGEAVIDINVISLEKNSSCAVVLGERNIFAIKDTGKLWFMKKFDFCPMSMCSYLTENGDLIVLIASEMRTLLIYNNDILKWAAKLPFTPIAVRRANVGNMRGSVVCLSENGFLCCCYLGTNPSVNIIANNSEVNISNYAEAEQELHELRKIINTFNVDSNTTNSHNSTLKSAKKSEVSISIGDFHSVVDSSVKLKRKVKDTQPLLAVNVNLQAFVSITNVRLMVEVSDPILVDPKIVTFASIAANESLEATQFNVTLSNHYIPQHLKFKVIVTFVNSDGTPKVYRKHLHLPLSLVAKLSTPVREADHLFSLDAECQTSINLNEIFWDLTDRTEANASDGFSLNISLFDTKLANVGLNLTSKAAHYKFCFKSNSLASLGFVASELIRRLSIHKVKFNKASLDKNSLPIQAYLKLIEIHLNYRHQIKKEQEHLSTVASQFRALEKRLLVKMKDRNPTPLANLDLILESTHTKILNLNDNLIDNTLCYRQATNALSAATHFLCLWLSIATNLPKEQQTLLNAALTPNITADVDEGWEERIETSLITLFEHYVKDTIGISKFAKMELSAPENINIIRNLIITAIDHIYSGDLLSSKTNATSYKIATVTHKTSTLAENDVIPEEDEAETTQSNQLNNSLVKVSTV